MKILILHLTIDLFLYLEKVNFDPLCTSVRLCIISHATVMFFGPWINLWLWVDCRVRQWGWRGGVGLRDRSILQRWQFCFRGWGHPIYPTTINFLFLSHLIEVPGLAEPWYYDPSLIIIIKGLIIIMKQAIQCNCLMRKYMLNQPQADDYKHPWGLAMLLHQWVLCPIILSPVN